MFVMRISIATLARVAIVLLLLVVGVSAEPRPRRTARVEVREITATATFDCTAAAPHGTHVALTPSEGVTIGRVMATEGARVRRGDVLLMISDPHTRNAYRNATSALRSARARLQAAREQYRPYLDTAARRVRGARERVASAEASVARARNAVTVYDAMPSSGTTVSRADGVVVAGAHEPPPRVVVRRQADPAAVRAASASLTAARNERAAAERSLADAKLHVRKTLAPLERRRDQAYAAFREAQRERKDDQVKATISGTLVSVGKPGQSVARGQTMAEVVQLDKVVAVLVGPREALQPLALNQRVVLSMSGRALPAVIAGKRDVGGKTKITVRFHNAEHRVKPGDRGKVTARTAHAAAVTCVPVQAVRDGRVTVMRGGQWREVSVETGISDGRWVAIKRGLQPNEEVALDE